MIYHGGNVGLSAIKKECGQTGAVAYLACSKFTQLPFKAVDVFAAHHLVTVEDLNEEEEEEEEEESTGKEISTTREEGIEAPSVEDAIESPPHGESPPPSTGRSTLGSQDTDQYSEENCASREERMSSCGTHLIPPVLAFSKRESKRPTTAPFAETQQQDTDKDRPVPAIQAGAGKVDRRPGTAGAAADREHDYNTQKGTPADSVDKAENVPASVPVETALDNKEFVAKIPPEERHRDRHASSASSHHRRHHRKDHKDDKDRKVELLQSA